MFNKLNTFSDIDNLKKIMRFMIAGFMFLCLLRVVGMDTREAQQFAFMLFALTLINFMTKNIWVSLFVWWTSFLYAYFKCNMGTVYILNIMFGVILYIITKIVFEKKHIDFLVKIFLWVVAVNLIFTVLQQNELDFMYKHQGIHGDGTRLTGFMGGTTMLAMLFAFAIPILASRQSIMAYIASGGLLYIVKNHGSSASLIAAMIGLLFVLWFKINKKIWILIFIILLFYGIFNITKIDTGGYKTRAKMWQMVLRNAVQRPIIGYGLDSFRNITQTKSFKYLDAIYPSEDKTTFYYSWWDNPHNLYLSLFYEFGVVSLLILLGYLRQLVIWFRKAEKLPNAIGLAGFLIVLLVVSIANFPLFLARFTCFIIPLLALFEKQIGTEVINV